MGLWGRTTTPERLTSPIVVVVVIVYVIMTYRGTGNRVREEVFAVPHQSVRACPRGSL